MSTPSILFIEPFYGGSHKQLLSLITKEIGDHALFTLPAKKWHWRARTSALHFSQVIPSNHKYRVLFCSSVLNLAELIALRPDLGCLIKIVYFHENQLVYPVRKYKDRDFQYGYNQILSSLVADVIVFNSHYNQESFLRNIKTFLKLIPDQTPGQFEQQIRSKSRVLYFPLKFPITDQTRNSPDRHTGVPGEDLEPGLQEKVSELNISDQSNSKTDTKTGKSPSDCSQLHVQDSKEILSDVTLLNTDACRSNSGDTDDFQSHGAVSSSAEKEHFLDDAQKSKGPQDVQHYVADMRTEDKVRGSPDGKSLFLSKDMFENSPAHNNENSPERNLTCSVSFHTCTCRVNQTGCEEKTEKPLHIVWPHRWEHDKDPQTFFTVLYRLCEKRFDFTLSVLGEQYQQIPDIFTEARERLNDHISVWGYQHDKVDYYAVLQEADVVVSTALHEFFGVAMLEATHFDCYPLCPNRLVYPEIVPKTCLYNTVDQLYKRLREFCRRPYLARNSRIKDYLNLDRFSWDKLMPKYRELLNDDNERRT